MRKVDFWFSLVKNVKCFECFVVFCYGFLGNIRRFSIIICKIEIMIMFVLNSYDYIS